MWVRGIAMMLVGLALAAWAQDAVEEVPANGRAFEVASVRVSDGRDGHLTIPQGTQVTERSVSLTNLLQLAFGLEASQISGPDWMNSSLYDVMAKLPGGVSLTNKQMHVPLQKLLEDRFKLKTHWEEREKPGYALVLAKGGLKMARAKEGAPKGGNIMTDSVQMQSATMVSLAGVLEYVMKQPVVDKTGIDGDYELKLSFAPEGKESTLPSVFTAVQEQLGLKLEPQKVPVNMLVVDHLEKVPAEN